MTLLKLLRGIIISFFIIISVSASGEMDDMKSKIIQFEGGEVYIEKIEQFVGSIHTNTIRLKLIESQLEDILQRYDFLESQRAQEIKLILQYFQRELQQEIASNVSLEEVPKSIKSVYYTSYAASSSSKIESLLQLVKDTEVNSVIIDIKEVDGYVAFNMSEYDFGNIKPITNNRIKDIKKLISELHEHNIYVIGRVVVFKDNFVAENYPAHVIKWEDGITPWYDYKGNKYLDPYSQDVWDYTVNISKAAYDVGFDEINYDYVRFPSDGAISKTYYPFANTLVSQNPRWGKIMALDSFSHYVTSELREMHPDIVLSADIFGLVTTSDLFGIGQNLESFLLYFDYVAPMMYPSHYGAGTLGHDIPDNHPYEIFKHGLDITSKRIEALNLEIEQAKIEQRGVFIKDAFYAKKELGNMDPISQDVIRPWIQGFSCSWCKGATRYNRTKFREQIRAIVDAGYTSWYVWNSASNYYTEWYD